MPEYLPTTAMGRPQAPLVRLDLGGGEERRRSLAPAQVYFLKEKQLRSFVFAAT